MCVCMCVCLCECLSICVCMCICECLCLYVCTCVCMYPCKRPCLYVCACSCACAFVNACVYMHVPVYVCACVQSSALAFPATRITRTTYRDDMQIRKGSCVGRFYRNLRNYFECSIRWLLISICELSATPLSNPDGVHGPGQRQHPSGTQAPSGQTDVPAWGRSFHHWATTRVYRLLPPSPVFLRIAHTAAPVGASFLFKAEGCSTPGPAFVSVFLSRPRGLSFCPAVTRYLLLLCQGTDFGGARQTQARRGSLGPGHPGGRGSSSRQTVHSLLLCSPVPSGSRGLALLPGSPAPAPGSLAMS